MRAWLGYEAGVKKKGKFSCSTFATMVVDFFKCQKITSENKGRFLIFKTPWPIHFINDFIICSTFNLTDVESAGAYELDLITSLLRWVCSMHVLAGIPKLKVVEIGWDVAIKFLCRLSTDTWTCRYI